MLTLLALGCSFGLAPGGPEEKAATAPRIDAVDPASGSTGGGTTVTITGAGFTEAVTVGFGGVWGQVTVLDASTLAVTTPGIGAELTVDVTVETDAGVATLADGYRFLRVAGDTGGEDTWDTDVQAGMVGGYAQFEWSDHACPSCFGLASTVPTVTASARFHAPADGSWLSWVPADGACESEAAPNVLAAASLDAGANVVLDDGAREVVLASTAGGSGVVYTSDTLTTASYTAGGAWEIAARGGAGVDSFRLADALRTPVDFDIIQPTALLAETTSGAFVTTFGSGSGTPITWSPTGVGDYVLVTVEASRGGAYLGSTTCRSPDDGSLIVPASAVSGWSNGDRLAVRIARYSVEETVLPDGSTLETVGRIERVGTGVVQY